MSCDKYRILHIITSLRTGGAEQLVTDLLPRLHDRGHRAELLLFDGTRTPLYEQLEQQGITIYSLGCGARQMHNPLHLFRLGKYLRKERFDIVHTHNTPCQLLTALAAGKEAPALVTTEHNTFNRRRNWRWYAALDRRMYRRYSHIICVGEKTRHNLEKRLSAGPDAPAITTIPNGIDLDRFFQAEADTTLRTPEETDKKIIVMVAAFRPQKDQPTLLKAMQHLPGDYRLWLAGDGTEQTACKQLAGELGIGNRVRFWGIRSDIPALLAAADIVVLSSHYEGMPLSGIEGMASGKPFIASDVDGLREIAGEAGLLFPHGDSTGLAALIRQVCENPEYGADVAARCRKHVLQYDIGTVVSRYEQIYRNILHDYK